MSNDVEIVVTTRDRGASSGIRRVGDEAESMARRIESSSSRSSSRWSAMGGMLAGVGKVATMALGGIALGAGAVATAGITMGLKTAAGLEQAKISYDTLLHSTDKAKQHLADLTKFAAATPFELPGLIQTDRLLIGAGEDASKTLKTLTAWGDAAGALGMGQEQFSRAMLALSQAMGAGKLQAGDLLQITEAGLPIWKLLSEALGKPVSEIRKLSEQGKLLTNDVLPKLEKQMEKDYGGSMAKQSQTLNGVWSTFMDTLNIGLAKAIQPLLPTLKDALPKAAEGLGKALAWSSGKLADLIGWTKRATSEGGILRESWDKITGAGRAFGNFWSTYINPVLRFFAFTIGPAVSIIIANIKGSIDNARTSGVPWLTLLKALGVALGILAGIIAGVVVAALVMLSTQIRIATLLIKPLWSAFVTLNKIVLSSIENMLSALLALARTMAKLPGPLGAPWRAMVGPLNNALGLVRAMKAQLDGIKSRTVSVNVKTLVNGRPASITDFGTYANIKSGGNTRRAYAHGGVVGAASGGLRSNLTMVGEYGAELLDLPPGTRVHSNADTGRMMTGAGGGSVMITLNCYAPIGSQAQLEDWLAGALIGLKRKGRLVAA